MSGTPAARLRNIATSSGEHDGQRGVFLRDPLGVARDTHFLPFPSWAIARALDGLSTPTEIAQKLNDESRTRLEERDVLAVIEGLSKRLLLEDELFEEALSSELRRFRDSGQRPCIGAGSDYEADPTELRIKLAGLVADDWDMPQLPHAAGLLCPSSRIADVRALYARGYASIRHARPARIVLMASAGMALPKLCVPLDMDLQTPFGPVPVDREGLAALGMFSGAEVLAHRDHLALERQALFLRLLFRQVPVVPILIGSLADSDPDPYADREPEIEAAVRSLARVLDLPGQTLLVCAADLGGLPGSSELSAEAMRAEDTECIDQATRLDPEAFRAAGRARGEDPARCASLSAPYLFLRALKTRERAAAPIDPSHPEDLEGSESADLRGSTLGYRQFGPPAAVRTAASVVFH